MDTEDLPNLLLVVQLVQKRVQPHNVNQYISFADRFTLHGLQEMCQNFVIDNFCAVIQHPDFFHMSPKTFKFVLQSDSLCIDSEFTIFQVNLLPLSACTSATVNITLVLSCTTCMCTGDCNADARITICPLGDSAPCSAHTVP
jgi:hypothetical protein